MNWSASVLSTVSSDTEPTIILGFESSKYIFNVGENTNRAFLQSNCSWRRTRGLFFTQLGTQRMSGLPGLMMSFADATISRLDIVGPPGLTHFLASMRSYTYRDTMPIYPTEASWTISTSSSPAPLYQDKNINVYSIPIFPSPDETSPSQKTSSSISDPSPVMIEDLDQSLKRKREPSPDSASKRPAKKPPSLKDLIQDPGFTPGELTGDLAQEWRQLMVKLMFPYMKEKILEHKRKQLPTGHRFRISSPPGRKFKPGKGAPDAGRESKTDESVDVPPVSLEEDKTGSSSNPPSNVEMDIYNRDNLPLGFYKQLPRFTHHDPSLVLASTPKPALAYIAVGPRVRGKFDVKKAEELGVPFGPKRGKLTKGESVTVKVKVDGRIVERVVKPEECVGESEVPVAVLILDIPTKGHIPSLVSAFDKSPFYAKFRSTRVEDLGEYAVRSVFHICGDGVLEDERYVAFMNGFAPHVDHVVASREHTPDKVTFTSAAYNQLRLNKLDPEIFPIPKHTLSPKRELSAIRNLPPTTIPMTPSLTIQMRPPAPPTYQTPEEAGDLFHPAVSAEDVNASLWALPALTLERFVEAQKDVIEQLGSGGVVVPKGADVRVVPLGTGSAIPTKYRNVSATLIRIPNWGSILLDCGEGTWGQLVRQFGSDGVWEVLRDLKCIYVSHIHGDHHMGLAQVLAKRRLLDPPPSEPVYLVTLRAIHLYIREYSDLQDVGLEDVSGNGVVTVMCEALHWKRPIAYQTSGMWQIGGDEGWTDMQQSITKGSEMCRALGLTSFQTVDVFHRTRCYGAVIKHTDGWSIVFSGDTQPTNTLVQAGQNATLLIHEATMADDEVEMAKQKAHSTIGQAIDIGRRMNAEHVLLTHFSARYPKMPRVRGNGRQGIGFDHMEVRIGDMWKLDRYLGAIEESMSSSDESAATCN